MALQLFGNPVPWPEALLWQLLAHEGLERGTPKSAALQLTGKAEAHDVGVVSPTRVSALRLSERPRPLTLNDRNVWIKAKGDTVDEAPNLLGTQLHVRTLGLLAVHCSSGR